MDLQSKSCTAHSYTTRSYTIWGSHVHELHVATTNQTLTTYSTKKNRLLDQGIAQRRPMFPRIRIPSSVSSLPIPMLRQTPNFLILALVILIFTGSIIYTIFQSSNWPWYYHFCPTPPPNYLAASSHTETISLPAARYLKPRALIDSVSSTSAGSVRSGGIEREINEGVPKIIHQSWMDGNLPVKFSKWSDSLRIRHPDWSWVSIFLQFDGMKN